MKKKNIELKVKIYREDLDKSREFSVRKFQPMTVLDVLLAVSRKIDDSLAFRFSCRVGMCGTCLVRVNGQSVLACQRPVREEDVEMTITPAAGFDVIRDLVVDTNPFWRAWAKVIPYFVPKANAREIAVIPHTSQERLDIDPHLDCIQCGACFSSCGVSGGGNDFVGPAALNRAFVLNSDSRDNGNSLRDPVIDGEAGTVRCHNFYGCSITCPRDVDPFSSIRRLRTHKVTKDSDED